MSLTIFVARRCTDHVLLPLKRHSQIENETKNIFACMSVTQQHALMDSGVAEKFSDDHIGVWHTVQEAQLPLRKQGVSNVFLSS